MLRAREGLSAYMLVRFACLDSVETSPLTVWSIIIDKIQIVRPEIYTPKRCSSRHSKSRCSRSCKGGIEIRSHSKSTCISIINTGVRVRNCHFCPDYVDCVVALVLRVSSLAYEICWSTSSHIDLLLLASCLYRMEFSNSPAPYSCQFL